MNDSSSEGVGVKYALALLWFAFGGLGTALGLLMSLVTWAMVGEPSVFMWLPGTMFVLFFVGASYVLPPHLASGMMDNNEK